MQREHPNLKIYIIEKKNYYKLINNEIQIFDCPLLYKRLEDFPNINI